MKNLVAISALILVCFSAKGQVEEIKFHPITGNINSEIKTELKNKDLVKLQFDKDSETINKVYKNIVTSVAKDWLKKAKALEKKLQNPAANVSFNSYLNLILGSDIESYKRELDRWIEYLSENSATTYRSHTLSFSYFPTLPETASFASTYSSFLKFLHIEKLYDGSKLIKDDGKPFVHLDLVYQDLIKKILVNWYNQSLSGTNIANIDLENLPIWENDLAQSVKDITYPLLNFLNDSTKIYADTNCIIDSIKKATHYINSLNSALNNSELVKHIDSNKSFFQKWLWYSGGEIAFNPFPFTDPDKFLTDPFILKQQASLFDTLAAKKLNCDVCKSSLDTLQYLISQQGTGSKRFNYDSAVKKLSDNNKAEWKAFLAANVTLYGFNYPYKKIDDDEITLQEYDASKTFLRCDYLISGVKEKRISAANENVSTDKAPAVIVYNIPIGGTIKLTPLVKDSVVTSIANQNIGNFLAEASKVVALLSPLNSVMTSIASLSSKTILVPPMIIKHTPRQVGLSDVGTQPIIMDTLKGIFRILVNDYSENTPQKRIEIPELDSTYDFDPQTCKMVSCDEETLPEFICQFYARQKKVTCMGNIIDSFLKKNGYYLCCNAAKILNDADLECCLNKLVNDFAIFLDKQLAFMSEERKSLFREIKNKLNQSIFQSLASMKNLQVPPDQISLNDTASIADDSYKYSQVFYLPPLDQGKQSGVLSYSLAATKAPRDTTITGNFIISKKKYYAIGAGFAGTFSNYLPVTHLSTSNPVSFNQDNDKWRFVAGVHIYPLGMLINDNRFIIHGKYGESSWSRLSLFLGVGIPKPLENLYSGLSADLFPGLRLHAGTRWAYYTKYEVLNNQLKDQNSAVTFGGWYVGLNIEPSALVSLLNIFK